LPCQNLGRHKRQFFSGEDGVGFRQQGPRWAMVGFLEPAPRRLPSRGAILILLSGLAAWLALLLWTFAALVRPKRICAGE
jgi:hypothetical protein